jgi:TonB family protein
MTYKKTFIAMTLILVGGGVLNAGTEPSAIEAPQALKIVEPEVPYAQTRWGATGEIVVTFQINKEGETTNIQLVSADDTVYAAKVQEAVSQWRFEAPEVEGVTYRQTVRFN